MATYTPSALIPMAFIPSGTGLSWSASPSTHGIVRTFHFITTQGGGDQYTIVFSPDNGSTNFNLYGGVSILTKVSSVVNHYTELTGDTDQLYLQANLGGFSVTSGAAYGYLLT